MRICWAAVLFSCALLLSGCAGMPVANTIENTSVQGAALQGRVHGGQNPIAGAHVYLYASNTAGYGKVSISVLTSASGTTQDGSGNYYVTTDSNGMWTITGNYTCPNSYTTTYIFAVGGNPGAGANSAAVLVAPVRDCHSSDFIVVNEVSTIASVYAFAGFAADPSHLGSSGSALALTAMDNSADTLANLEDQATGLANATTLGGNGTVPQAEINTLANILAACVNSTGPGSTACSTLFSNAKNGATAPTDTATAALNIAHNPGANISALYALQTASSPFQPMLSAAPNDWTIAIKYGGGGLNQPAEVAIDGSGNVWIPNSSGSKIIEFGPDGSVVSGSSGFTGGGLYRPVGVAVDGSGNVWVGNIGNSTLSEFNSSGSPVSSSSGDTGGGLDDPWGIAIDTSGNIWAANNEGNSLSEFSSSGAAISGSNGYAGGGLNGPYGIAIDVSGNIWAANNGDSSISEFNSSGTANGSSPFTSSGLVTPYAIAIDAPGNIWVADKPGNSISEFDSSGTANSSSPFTGGGVNNPHGIAIDGSNNVWVTNHANNTISELNSSGSAVSNSPGYEGGELNAPEGIAVDGSGNVWVANTGNNSLSEFVGVATPVVTPIVANLLTPYGTYAVNKP